MAGVGWVVGVGIAAPEVSLPLLVGTAPGAGATAAFFTANWSRCQPSYRRNTDIVKTKKSISRCVSIASLLGAVAIKWVAYETSPRISSSNSLNNAALSRLRGLPLSCTTTSRLPSSVASRPWMMRTSRLTRLRSTDRGAAFLPTIRPRRGPFSVFGRALIIKLRLPLTRPPASTASNCAGFVKRPGRARGELLLTPDLIKR